MQSIAYIPGSNGTGNASQMTVQNVRAPGASDILVNTVTGVPTKFYASMGAPHTFTDPVTGETITLISEATAVDFAGHIDSGKLVIDAIAPGYVDTRGSLVGDIVVVRPITEWANNLFNILSAEHKDDGKHSNITADTVRLNDGTDIGNQGLYQNAIINGGMLVAQRAAQTLSSTYQYGQVDRFAVKATGTAVSAGSIAQEVTTPLAAARGADLKISGATITGSGIVFLRYRMESKDAQMFKNAAASLSFKVYHDLGASVNATIYVRKANAVDNFAAVTDIANSGAIAIPHATSTTLKFENINTGSLGDVTNGIEIEVQITTGAITTKNISFGEFQFNKGSKASLFNPRPMQQEFQACLRYFYSLHNNVGATYLSGIGAAYIGGGQSWIVISVATPMRTTPTISHLGLGVRYGGADFSMSNPSIVHSTGGMMSMVGTTPGTGNGNSGTGWIAPANGRLLFDAEL